VIGIGVVVVALVVAGVAFGVRGLSTQSPAIPTGVPSLAESGAPGIWSTMHLTLPNDTSQVIESDVDGIALISTNMDDTQTVCIVTAVDVMRLSVLWTMSTGCFLFPGAEGLVTVQTKPDNNDHVQVIDTTSGAVTATADFAVDQDTTAVGNGIVFVENQTGDNGATQGCVRDMTLGPCLWEGPGNDTWGTDATVDVFGNYSWINTSDGIRDLRTGAPAPFGSHADQCDGPSVDRVLCVTWGDSGEGTYQQVNTTTGKPIGPTITPMYFLSFSEDSSVYTFLQDESDTQSHLVGYSWDTGKKVFDTTVDGRVDTPDWMVPQLAMGQAGGTVWAYYSDPSGADGLAAFSLSSGKIVWFGTDANLLGITSLEGYSTVYVWNGSEIIAFDANTGQPKMAVVEPENLVCSGISGNRYLYVDDSGTLAVLNI